MRLKTRTNKFEAEPSGKEKHTLMLSDPTYEGQEKDFDLDSVQVQPIRLDHGTKAAPSLKE